MRVAQKPQAGSARERVRDSANRIYLVAYNFAGLHVHINLGAKWKGKKLTDNQKCYVVNLCKESHKDNVRV